MKRAHSLQKLALCILSIVSLCVGTANSLEIKSVLPKTARLLPQTFSFMYGKLNALTEMVKRHYNMQSPKKLHLLQEILKKELTFNKKGYTLFYHANKDHALILQEFFKALYCKLEGKIISDEFEFLRFYKMNGITTEAQRWLDSQGSIWDQSDPHRSLLLSTNLSLFGNAGWSGSSSLSYFETNDNCSPLNIRSVVEKTLEAIGRRHLAKDIHFQLQNLVNMARGFPSIIQIAIPNNLVNTTTYLSQAGGTPLCGSSEPLLQPMCKKNRIARTLEAINALSQNCEKTPTWLLNELQARILFQKDYMLNPFSGIKIVRHTLLPKKTLKKIKAGVASVVDAFITA